MTKKRSTKRALALSFISLLLCVSMFVGTTFAWFTDSVSSVNNKIVAGNLDVELEYYDADEKEWVAVDENTNVFEEETLWEPGHTEVVYLKVVNKGTLALKYQLGVNVASEILGKTEDGKDIKLSDYIEFGVIESNTENFYENREAAVAAVSGSSVKLNEGYSKFNTLYPAQKVAEDVELAGALYEEYVTLVVYMPTTVGNEANYRGDDIPTINLGINLFASQLTYENDSFGSDYDEGASWVGAIDTDWYFADPDAAEFVIDTAEELAGLAALVNGTATAPVITYAADSSSTVQDSFKGQTVKLGGNIDLGNNAWTPIGNSTNKFQGTFDGQGYTVSNLNVDMPTKSNVGLFGFTTEGEIKNLTVENATVSGYLAVGVVAGQPYTSKYTDITVKGHVEVNGFAYVGGVGGRNAYANWTNITVDVDETSYVKAVSTENGTSYRTYVGGVVGFNGEGGHTFKNITSNIDVIGDVCDIGGAFGIAHYNNNFVNVIVTGNVKSTGVADEIGGIAGVWHNENGTSVTFTDCEFSGTVSDVNGAVTGCDIVGAAYGAGTGVLIIDGKDVEGNWAVTDVASLENALTKGGNVKVYGNVTLTESLDVPAGVEVAIDLNGKSLTAGSDGYVIYNENGGVLVIGDSTSNGSVTGVIYTGTGSETVVNGGTYNAVSGGKYVFLNSAGSLTINGGTVNGGSSYPLYSYDDGHKLVINDVTVNGTFGCINAYSAGSVEVNGGQFYITGVSGKTSHLVYISGTTKATINGGTFKKIGDISMSGTGGGGICSAGSAEIVIKGGSFAGDYRDLYVWSANSKITVYGGTYKFRPTSEGAKIADGYKAVNSGSNWLVIPEAAEFATDNAAFGNAIQGGADTIYLGSGTYIIPAAAQGKTLTIIGTGDTTVAVTKVGTGGENCDYGLDGSTVVFENVTITTNSSTYIGYARCNATYNNCTFNGTYTLYGNSVFNNCTFNVSGDVYNIWTWGAPTVEFNGCTFNSDGKAVLLYGTANTKLTVNGCTFNDNGGLTDKKAAIEIGNDYGKSYELIVNNTVVNGYEINDKGINTGTTLWANKNSMGTDKLNVVVDGVDVY